MKSGCCSQLLSLYPSPYRSSSSSSSSTPRHSFSTVSENKLGWRNGMIRSGNTSRGRSILFSPIKCLPRGTKVISYLRNSENSAEVREEISSMPNSSVGTTMGSSGSRMAPMPGPSGSVALDPLRGKSGSVSFCGLTHQILEERKLVSSPFKEGTGSFVWALAPLALISSLLLPQFFLGNAIEAFLNDAILAEIIVSFLSEFIFYAGLAAFLLVTDHVQRPYLEFSPKRWSLITGLNGYLSSAFFIMGFKVFAPLLTAYVVWPVIGLPALIAVAPFLLGCAAQFAFELHLSNRRSSCWPLLPIIFEMYRLYQLTKGAHFIERLMFSMRGSSMTPVIMERSGALVSMLAVFQILGVVCLWSLATFLLRLFPSRPVAENY